MEKHVKSARHSWMNHVSSTENTRTPTSLLNSEMIGVIKKGKPRMRSIQDVERSMRTMGIRRWKEMIQQRSIWKGFVKEARH